MSGKAADPAWRQARAQKAGLGNRRRHERERLERGERYSTKGRAYAAGYRLGYQKAMDWWRRKLLREATS